MTRRTQLPPRFRRGAPAPFMAPPNLGVTPGRVPRVLEAMRGESTAAPVYPRKPRGRGPWVVLGIFGVLGSLAIMLKGRG